MKELWNIIEPYDTIKDIILFAWGLFSFIWALFSKRNEKKIRNEAEFFLNKDKYIGSLIFVSDVLKSDKQNKYEMIKDTISDLYGSLPKDPKNINNKVNDFKIELSKNNLSKEQIIEKTSHIISEIKRSR